MKAAELSSLLPLVLAPLGLLALACFLKFSIVLSLLGRALGGRALPSVVVFGTALLLVGFVLAPTAERVGAELASGHAAEPVRSFLEAHVGAPARAELLELQRKLRPERERAQVTDRDLAVLGPAFALSELKSAFRVGFFLLLPFLVLDLLVAVALLGLGMHSIEARVIALPLKLLLFIAVDGWGLLARGLLVGYT